MAHVEKYTKTQVGALCRHDTRDENSVIERSNEHIDQSRTHLNYNLAQELQPLSAEVFLKKRLSEIKVMQRDDVNVMCSWCVTLPKTFPKEREDEFFTKTFEFLCNKYGEKNVITACVHKDETTPHLHFKFVPVAIDSKSGREKCCAKEVINRPKLRLFHKELQSYLENFFGFEVDVMNGATGNGAKNIHQLQADSLKKEIEELREEKIKTAENPTFFEKLFKKDGFVAISSGEYEVLSDARNQMDAVVRREVALEEKELAFNREVELTSTELKSKEVNINRLIEDRVQEIIEPKLHQIQVMENDLKKQKARISEEIEAEAVRIASERIEEAAEQLQRMTIEKQKAEYQLNKVLNTKINGKTVDELIKDKNRNRNYER